MSLKEIQEMSNAAQLAQSLQHQYKSVTGNNLLLQQLAMSKGGRIGTNGKPAVALRFDDWQDAFRTNIYPLLTARGLPCSMALISRFNTAQPWGAGTTWADIKTWNKNGVEIWSHGTDHNDYVPEGYAGLYREVVTSKAEIEAQGLKVQGWAMPGATPLTEATPYNGLTTLSAYSGEVGQLLMETYALTEAYAGRFFRNLTNTERHGMNHYTVSDGNNDLATATAYIDYAIANKVGVEFMCHAGNLGGAGNMSLANFTLFLDYIVTKREAGELEVLTPSGLAFADIDASYRWDICRSGNFLGLTTGSPGAWSNTSDWTGKSFPQTGGKTGGAYLSLSTESPASGFVLQKATGLNSTTETYVSGEQWLFEGWFRSNGAGNAIARIFLADSQVPANMSYTVSRTSNGANWTKFTYAFGVPTVTGNLYIGVGRDTGDGVDWSDVSVKKI
jgi:peptidoglycan/xylan/chitin deacetylase (PgdA/CDA1 family)